LSGERRATEVTIQAEPGAKRIRLVRDSALNGYPKGCA
jgi:hypothetical protein